MLRFCLPLCHFQPGAAYEGVDYIKSVYDRIWLFGGYRLFMRKLSSGEGIMVEMGVVGVKKIC